MNIAARHIATVAPYRVRIKMKPSEDALVLVRYLEDATVRHVTLGEFLDAHIQEMTDAEVDALHAGDKVALECPFFGPYTVEVVK